jgi:hypothetical protein
MGEYLLIAFFVWLAYWILSSKKKPEPIDIPVTITVTTRFVGGANNDDDDCFDDTSASDKDAWEPFDRYNAKEIPGSGKFKITYTDTRGMTTEREIQVKRVLQSTDDTMIDALCLLRGAHRSFLNSRIQGAVDADTGEIVADLPAAAVANYKLSPAGQAGELFGREEDALGILLFVAKADGRMLKAERAIIANYLTTHHPDILLSAAEIDAEIKKLWVPDSIAELRRILKRLSADTTRLAVIGAAAKAMVATQKTVDPAEQLALDLIEQALA